MKRSIFVLLVILSSTFFSAHAQSYKINKQNYDHKMYVRQPGDPNIPWLMGLSSAFVPGLGQMISGETGRGIAFLGSSLALTGVTYAGLAIAVKDVETYSDGSTSGELNSTGVAIMLAGLAATIAVDVWAIVDAVKVAKVNNMYFQDVHGNLSRVEIDLNPFVDTKNYLGQTNISGGLSLKVTF